YHCRTHAGPADVKTGESARIPTPVSGESYMSVLSVYHQNRPEQPLKVLTHHDDIAATLAEAEVRFEHLDARAALAADASPEEGLAACRPQIDGLQAERDFASADVLRVTGNDRQQNELRARFLEEHRHAEDEVRFIVAGRGLF